MPTLLHGIPKPLAGERVVQVHPAIAPQVDTATTWRQRSNLFSGRSLGPSALGTDQTERAGRLALSGQSISSGVIAGLEVSVERIAAVSRLQVAPGFGIAVSGEDVRLTQALSIPLDTLPITLTQDIGGGELVTDTRTLAVWRDPGGPRPFNPFPLAAIVLLQPIVVNRTGEQDSEDACELDEGDLAFEDEQIVDGARLILLPFPRTFTQIPFSPRWRNELAYEIFRREAALGPSGLLPWETDGLGIALLGIADQAAEAFVDVHSVARDGGELNRHRPFFGAPGTRKLWQARVRQFIDELGPADPDELRTTTELRDTFRFLPPVGTLPAGAVDVRGDRGEPHLPLPPSSLFPETFVLEATPVELEAVDDYLRASANLLPFDTQAEEQVQILVPVPQRNFSPDLLRVEDETPDEFREAIRLFLLLLNHRLGRRDDLRRAEVRLSNALFAITPQHALQDDTAVPGEVLTGFPDDDQIPATELPPLEEAFADSIEDVVFDLGQRMARMAGPTPLAQIVEELRAEAKNQTPVDQNASVVSAATALVTTNSGERGLVGFVQELSKRLVAASEALDIAFSRTSSNLFELRQLASGDAQATQLAISPALPFIVGSRTQLTASSQVEQFKGFLARTRIPGTVDSPTQFRSTPDRTLQILTRQLPGAETIPAAVVFNEDIKKRLESPPALDLAENAARAKRAAFRALRSIHEDGLSFSGLKFRGFLVESTPNADGTPGPLVRDPNTQDPPAQHPSLDAKVSNGRLKPVDVPIKWVIAFLQFFEADSYWPHDSVTGLNEGAIMATSFESVEHTISGLRVAEARLSGLERSLTLARDQLEQFRTTWNRLQRRLAELEAEITEFRRDVRVAQALEIEEIARAKTVNAQRREVLQNQVPFLVFRRPRTIDALLPSPTHLALPALAPDPVPACLKSNFETPDPLRIMVDLLREAPLAWSTLGSALLPLVNRHVALQQLVRVALHRAANPVPVTYDPFSTTAFDDDTGQRIRAIFESQRRAIDELRAQRLRLEFASFVRFSWGGLLSELRPVATVNDLILTAHGRQEVSDQLSRHLDDFNRVTACLFERMRQVRPVLRFVWSEILEEATTPVDLRTLSVLPDWQLVEPSEQRNMQALVDWLYAQLAPGREDAVRFMHDLVRMTILLTAHAPVNQNLSAIPVNVRPVVAGAVLEIAIESERVRVGMHVQLFESAGPVPPAAQGLVEDLAQGVATVRISTTESDRSVLPVRAEVIEPDRNPQVQLATGGLASFGVVSLDR